MFNEQLIQKICSLECSYKELKRFCRNQTKKRTIPNNLFDKYYDVNTILLALTKLQQEEVDEWYMSSWTEAYYRIIEDGFKTEYGQKKSLQQYVRQRIAHNLWYLSVYFLDFPLYNPIDIEQYKRLFSKLDRILRDVNVCIAVCARKRLRSHFPEVLIVNDDEKYFITETYYYDDWDDYVKDDEIEFDRITMCEFKCRINNLKEQGYTQLYI